MYEVKLWLTNKLTDWAMCFIHIINKHKSRVLAYALRQLSYEYATRPPGVEGHVCCCHVKPCENVNSSN